MSAESAPACDEDVVVVVVFVVTGMAMGELSFAPTGVSNSLLILLSRSWTLARSVLSRPIS